MRLLPTKKIDAVADTTNTVEKLKNCEEKRQFFLQTIRALLVFIQNFSMDLDELEAAAFKDGIRKLSDTFVSDAKPKTIQPIFEKQKKQIIAYIQRQKDYLHDSKKELKDVVDLLTQAMVNLDTDNQTFNAKMIAQSDKFEKITLLDDIKKIKYALTNEVTVLRDTLKEKEFRDRRRIEKLSAKVSHLDQELRQVKQASMMDGLTDIYNRKTFDRFVQDLVERNMISKTPFSMLMVDIDDFKRVNDTYGHQVGDRVLVAIAQQCAKFIRGDDMVARFGGEEFVIILLGASLRNATKKAKQISKEIAATRYALDGAMAGQVLSVTVSIGVSAYRHGDRVATVTERADQALYRAKRKGKNKAVSEKEVG